MSWVWKHFDKVDKDSAKCKKCDEEGKACNFSTKGGGTSNLSNHIKKRHPGLLASASAATTQSDIRAMGRLCDARKSALLKKKILNLVTVDLRPLSVVDGRAFVDLLHTVEPNLKNFGRKAISNLLEQQYEVEKEKVKILIGNSELKFGIATTADGWTSSTNQSYMTVTAHFIGNDWKLEYKNLCTKEMSGRHTAENIKEVIEATCNEFGVGRILSVTRDNARNMEKAVETSKEIDFGIACCAHLLQLALQESLQVPAIQAMLGVFRQNSRFFRKSGPGWQALKKKQGEVSNDARPKRPIMEVPTRWNSTFYMVQRLLHLRQHVDDIWTNDEDLRKDMKRANVLKPREDHWYLAKKLVKVLNPFEQLTTIWSGSKYVSVSTALPLVIAQLAKLEARQTDIPPIHEMKKTLQCALKKRFQLSEQGDTATDNHKVAILCCFLDPRFKSLHCFSEKDIEIAHRKVLDLMSEIDMTEPISHDDLPNTEDDRSASSTEDEESVPAKKSKHLAKLLGNFYQGSSADTTQTVKGEFDSYTGEPQIASENSPLSWWKKQSTKYPRISEVARAFLAIPATSVPSEQSFSKAGHITERRRANLSSGHVNQILFLHYNQDDPVPATRGTAGDEEDNMSSDDE